MFDSDSNRLLWEGTHVFLLCFALNSPPSLRSCEDFAFQIKTAYPQTPMILVGTKSELRDGGEESVSEFDGKNASVRMGASGYVEVSTSHFVGVTEVFTEAMTFASAFKKEVLSPKRSPRPKRERPPREKGPRRLIGSSSYTNNDRKEAACSLM
eukprot:TRINITY_DN3197_c0_g1_i4.p1 TRINITY_DN3197_c0_g1~~TRINITY_DN3197_c0_g1_i4.p1  ORF type:complete len:154 (-),score=52.19 TRINITY_DN3197_c0_g1_i4:169-630(-)